MRNKQDCLRIAVRKFDPFESALQKQWSAFCDQTGCNLQLQAVPMELPELHQKTLAEGGLLEGSWDIAQISSDWVQEAVSSNAVEDLHTKTTKHFWTSWPDSLLEMQTIDGKIVGIPFHDGPECLIYRKDLFASSKNKRQFLARTGKALQPPETWDDFVEVSTFFQQPERDLFGAVFAAYPDGHNAVFDFCIQVWSRGGTIKDAKGRINIVSPHAEDGLTFYRKLFTQENGIHPQSKEMESVRAGNAFAQGKVAMMVNWFGFASLCEFSKESNIKGKIDVTTIPHSKSSLPASLNSYWMYMIGKGSAKKELALDFIAFATNQENDSLLTLEGGIGCRKTTWSNQEVNRHVPYFNKLEQLHQNARCLPAAPYWPEVATVIDQVVQKAIHTTDPIAEILKEGQVSINKIIKNYGNTL